ncbi:MAG: hypothetical protein FJX71_02100 [Alphaproteobacteria bacterium]|nr:hypothetical protein [Alphaproteobacteria bacterium]
MSNSKAAIRGQRYSLTKEIINCQSSLKTSSKHLQHYTKDRPTQIYYENLDRQIQDYLKSLENVAYNPVHLNQCQNFLTAIHSIVGKHVADVPEMPRYMAIRSDKGLSKPILELSKRKELRRIHYVYESPKPKKAKTEQGGAEEDEETLEAVPFSSHRAAKTGGVLASAAKERKELE